MLFTAAHELTHFIKENSPEHFEALEKIVTESFTKNGISIDALIDKQIEKAKNDGREISREDAREEMIADACETMLANGSLVKKLSALKTENKGLWSALKRFFDNLFSKIDKLYRTLKPDSAEGKYIADMRKTAKKLKAAFAEGLTAASEKTAAKTKKTVGKSMVKKSDRTSNKQITPEMSEDDRYEALKYRVLSLSAVADNEKISNAEQVIKQYLSDLNKGKSRYKLKLIKALATQFGVFKKYDSTDIGLDFVFSRNNFDESFNKQRHQYEKFAKMFSCFDEIIENSIGIEVHKRENYKEDPTLANMYVLVSAFKEGDDIVPVKLEIKEFKDKENALYVAIALESIKNDGVSEVRGAKSVAQISRPSNISIADFFEKINPSDKSFLKYIPDGFLNEEQKAAKRDAIRKYNESKIKPSSRSNMSTGQINKLKANYTHEKVYSKKLAFDIISRFSSAGDFKAKTREAIAESLWEGLNGCRSIEERNTFAHDTAVFVVGKMLSESRANNPDAEAAREKLAYLRSGIQRITFSESDIEEIKHLRDVAGHRSIQSRWGYKKKQFREICFLIILLIRTNVIIEIFFLDFSL